MLIGHGTDLGEAVVIEDPRALPQRPDHCPRLRDTPAGLARDDQFFHRRPLTRQRLEPALMAGIVPPEAVSEAPVWLATAPDYGEEE